MNFDDNMTILNERGEEIFYKPSQEERTLALLIFLLSFVTTVIGLLIIWLFKKNESAFIDHFGKEYFNMAISYFIYSVVSAILTFILIGFLLVPVVIIAGLVFTIIAAIKAYEGEFYRIPFLIRFF